MQGQNAAAEVWNWGPLRQKHASIVGLIGWGTERAGITSTFRHGADVRWLMWPLQDLLFLARNDRCRTIHNADAGLLDRSVQSSKIIHAALRP
jgi:hypothetical protein